MIPLSSNYLKKNKKHTIMKEKVVASSAFLIVQIGIIDTSFVCLFLVIEKPCLVISRVRTDLKWLVLTLWLLKSVIGVSLPLPHKGMILTFC